MTPEQRAEKGKEVKETFEMSGVRTDLNEVPVAEAITRALTPMERTPHIKVESITNGTGGPLPVFEINDKGQIIAMHENVEEAIRDARNQALEEAAKVADRRAAICRDAQKLEPETLPRIEIHTALEAEHIAAAIREKMK